MSAEKVESIPTIDRKPHAAFFRQSGWLMTATLVGGLMTLLVHPLNKYISDEQYTAFGVLLMLVACLPTMPLQMVFAQQTAMTLATGRERELGGMIRLAWLGTFLIWALGTALLFVFMGTIVHDWQLPGIGGLLVTLPLLLLSLWMPLFSGVMQGRQDFFWLGWATISSGVGRLGIAFALVLMFSLGATGMLAGALVGVGLWTFTAIWRTRDLWSLPAAKFDVKKLLGQVMPLVLGFTACQFMFTSDTLFAKAYFDPHAMKPYVAAGTMARGLLWMVMPLASVMFPKLVHAHARSEKSDLFGLVVVGTAVLGICGVLGLWLVGPHVVRMVFKPEDVAGTMRLLPWYSIAIVPLAMANVMVNHLLAHARFKVVPLMLVLAVSYGYALTRFHDSLVTMLQILGGFNLLLFLVCAVFVWGVKPKTKEQAARIEDRG